MKPGSDVELSEDDKNKTMLANTGLGVCCAKDFGTEKLRVPCLEDSSELVKRCQRMGLQVCCGGRTRIIDDDCSSSSSNNKSSRTSTTSGKESSKSVPSRLKTASASGFNATPSTSSGSDATRYTSSGSKTMPRTVSGSKTTPRTGFGSKTTPTSQKARKNEYEVESILDLRIKNGMPYYFVKWKGWQTKTWEPRSNLMNCDRVLRQFFKRYFGGDLNGDLDELADGSSFTAVRKNGLSFVRGSASAASGSKKTAPISAAEQEYRRKAAAVREQLKVWEDEINKVSSEMAPVTVENEVDLEGPPSNFTYINDYKPGEGIVIPDDPLVGCECQPDCISQKQQCCGHQSGSRFAYSKGRRVTVPIGSPIYECNKRCKCGVDCVNRLVQHGRKVKLAIFRTANGRGWGVKAMQKIKKGSFVTEYVGEVITSEEAEKRGKVYDAEGRTYLFDLDYNGGDCPFTVDAAHYGNVSHFVNHSCNPNLVVYGVWINTLDPMLPRVAFFTSRDVAKGEELTFDYLMTGDTTQSRSPVPTNRIPCRCNSANCRKFLF